MTEKERRLNLCRKKQAGWWVEYYPENNEYRMMQNRLFWIVIAKQDAEYFNQADIHSSQENIQGTQLRFKITLAWSNLNRLKDLEVDLETEIKDFISVQARSKSITSKATELILIKIYVSLWHLRNRIKLLTPPKGNKRTWAEFLRPENSKTTVTSL